MPTGGGRATKRDAIIKGARAAFGRDGYARASIDLIAAEAGVSSRTIYNHFGDKAGLFKALILESAEEVRSAQIHQIDRHLTEVRDVRSALYSVGLVFASTQASFPEHFALVRYIHADVVHLPKDVVTAWRKAGPQAVHEALTQALKALEKHGVLALQDPHRAAHQFVALVATEVNSWIIGEHPDPAFVQEAVRAGVDTFLRAYQVSAEP